MGSGASSGTSVCDGGKVCPLLGEKDPPLSLQASHGSMQHRCDLTIRLVLNEAEGLRSVPDVRVQ